MEYAFAPGPVLGLRQAGRFDRIVDVETCYLMSPESLELLQRARSWAKEAGLSGYDRRSHEGNLRYLVIREGKNTRERMAILIAVRLETAQVEEFQRQVEPLASTAWLGLTDARGDVARAQDMRLLWGSGILQERLGPLSFRVSPYSFFQTNTHGTERLYGLLREWAAASPGALVDVYCGSGGIALSLAGCFDRVIGVDTNREAIEDARMNAEHNGIGNAEFVCEDALDFLKKLPASKLAIQLSAAVVDPPRPGLHPKALKALLELNPPRLAYVSCNPESLARDLQSLVPYYAIQSVQPVDLFPHTPHVETLVALEHR